MHRANFSKLRLSGQWHKQSLNKSRRWDTINLGECFISILVISDEHRDLGTISCSFAHELAELAVHRLHLEIELVAERMCEDACKEWESSCVQYIRARRDVELGDSQC